MATFHGKSANTSNLIPVEDIGLQHSSQPKSGQQANVGVQLSTSSRGCRSANSPVCAPSAHSSKSAENGHSEVESLPKAMIRLFKVAIGQFVRISATVDQIQAAIASHKEQKLKDFAGMKVINEECRKINTAVESFNHMIRASCTSIRPDNVKETQVPTRLDDHTRCYAVEAKERAAVKLKPPFFGPDGLDAALPPTHEALLLLLKWELILHSMIAMIAAQQMHDFGAGTAIAEWSCRIWSVSGSSNYPGWNLSHILMSTQAQFALKSYYYYVSKEPSGFKLLKETLANICSSIIPKRATALQWPKRKDYLKTFISLAQFCKPTWNESHAWQCKAAVALLFQEERKEIEVLKCVADGRCWLQCTEECVLGTTSSLVGAVVALKRFRLLYLCKRWEFSTSTYAWPEAEINDFFEDVRRIFEAFLNILELNSPLWLSEEFKAEILLTVLPCLLVVELNNSKEIKGKCVHALARFITDDFLRIPYGTETDSDDLSIKLVAHCIFYCLAAEMHGPMMIEAKPKQSSFFAIRVYNALIIRRLTRHDETFYRSLQFIMNHISYIEEKFETRYHFERTKSQLRALFIILPALEERMNFENQEIKKKVVAKAPYKELINPRLYMEVYEDLRKDALSNATECRHNIDSYFNTSGLNEELSKLSVKSLENSEAKVLSTNVHNESKFDSLSVKKQQTLSRNGTLEEDRLRNSTYGNGMNTSNASAESVNGCQNTAKVCCSKTHMQFDNPWNPDALSHCSVKLKFSHKETGKMKISDKFPPLDEYEMDLKQMKCSFPVTLSDVKEFMSHIFAKSRLRVEPDLLSRFSDTLNNTIQRTLKLEQWIEFKGPEKLDRKKLEEHLLSKTEDDTEDIEELVDILHKSKLLMRFFMMKDESESSVETGH